LASNSGRQQWVREMSAFAGIAVAGGMVFVADMDGVVHALDAGSGSSTWKQEGLAFRWLSSPVAIGNHVVIGDLEGYVHWLDASDGKFAARARVGKQPIRAAPLAVGNDLFVADTEGNIAAFRVGG
jgi:outer membrane protein assembly factor BamB